MIDSNTYSLFSESPFMGKIKGEVEIVIFLIGKFKDFY